MEEKVNHPLHYQSNNGVECIDAIQGALGTEGTIQFCIGNAMKYLFRAGKKDVSPREEDFKKAIWYIEYALSLFDQIVFEDMQTIDEED